jgi:hypothetical protein
MLLKLVPWKGNEKGSETDWKQSSQFSPKMAFPNDGSSPWGLVRVVKTVEVCWIA